MYLFNTWLVANLLHPLLAMLLWVNWQDFNGGGVAGAFVLMLFSLLFSVPLLIMSWLILKILKGMRISCLAKFITWLLVGTFLPILTVLFISLFASGAGDAVEDLWLLVPATLSILVAILLRHKAFFKMINETQTTE
jgi:hypothetical protein